MNKQEKKNSTALHIAAEKGLIDCVKLLLQRGAKTDLQDCDGDTPLHVAQNTKIVEMLLQHGAPINVKNKCKQTALHIASEKELTDVVQLLLKKRAEANVTDYYGNTPLHVTKNCEIVQMLLKQGVSINVQNSYKQTALHIAAERGFTNCVKLLLEGGAKTDVKDCSDNTPLHLACNSEIVKMILDHGALVDVRNHYWLTALHISAKKELTDSVKLLLERGADAGMVDGKGSTPLHKTGNIEIVQMLLNCGAPINKKGKNERTALHKAADKGFTDCVELLLQCGAKTDLQDYYGNTPLHLSQNSEITRMLLKHGAPVNDQNNYKKTALHIVVKMGLIDHVKLLLEGGANTGLVNYLGETPLHLAQSSEIMKMLLNHGAPVNVKNYNKQTALHKVVEKGRTDCVQLLLEGGAKTDISERYNGGTLLHLAQSSEIVKMLLTHGVPVNLKNNSHMTALHIAAEKGLTDCVKVLLEKGAEADVKGKYGDTPLHLAKNGEIVSSLLNYGVPINVKNNSNRTALHTTAEEGSTYCVELLLKRGAEAAVKDKNGDTPLHLAQNSEIVRILLDRGIPVDVKNNSNRTALHIAAEKGLTDCVHLLLQQRAETDLKDNYGDTPLHLAHNIKAIYMYLENYVPPNLKDPKALGITALSNSECTVILLLNNKASVNALNNNGKTPLHLAVEFNNVKSVCLLCGAGADIGIYDKQGHTPLHVASMGGKRSIVQKLLDFGADINARIKEQASTLI